MHNPSTVNVLWNTQNVISNTKIAFSHVLRSLESSLKFTKLKTWWKLSVKLHHLPDTMVWYVCRVVDARHQLVDANSIVVQMTLKISVCMFPDYLLTYIDKHCVQHDWGHSTSYVFTLGCSLVEVTATRRWEEATTLQLHLSAVCYIVT